MADSKVNCITFPASVPINHPRSQALSKSQAEFMLAPPPGGAGLAIADPGAEFTLRQAARV